MTCRSCNCINCVSERDEVARAVGDDSHEHAKQLYAGAPHMLKLDYQFAADVLDEVKRAREKFPDQDSKITGLALGEESGEAQRALLHIHEGKSGEAELYAECVQTAAMALRLALESTDRLTWPGNVARARRDALAQIDTDHNGTERPGFARRTD